MDQPVDFETAISATRFGKFNIILFFIALPSTWSSEFDFTSTSYILPAAQCDLELSLVMKGWLNAIAYIGEYKHNLNYHLYYINKYYIFQEPFVVLFYGDILLIL